MDEKEKSKSDHRRCDLETAAVIFLSYCIWNIFSADL